MKLTPSQKRRKEKKRIYRKVHNIVHHNVRVDMRIHYYPITNKVAKKILPLLEKQLKSLSDKTYAQPARAK
jgi:hypothetical protein